jgi:processive 1,2-diacylglycerol beta-glucosyltransferase
MPAKKILVLHASAGAGHTQAANGVADALRRQDPSALVLVADALHFSTDMFRRAYVSSYNNIVRRAPGLYGFLYARSLNRRFGQMTTPSRLNFDKLSIRRMRDFVRRERPDSIVSAHFLPLALLSELRLKDPVTYPWPLNCVITDYTAHPFWVFNGISRYFVSSDNVVDELVAQDVPREKAVATGIPVNPKFALRADPGEARARLGLHAERPTVLVMGGGIGMGKLGDVVERVLAASPDYQCIAVCGRNARLRRALQGRYEDAEEREGRVAIRGFVKDVDRLMDAASIVISKAGGLTCSEAMAKGRPMLVLDPIPGQEERNGKYLASAGAAIQLEGVEEVEDRVREVLEPGGRLQAMSAAAARVGRPNAADSIARLVLEEIEAKREAGRGMAQI